MSGGTSKIFRPGVSLGGFVIIAFSHSDKWNNKYYKMQTPCCDSVVTLVATRIKNSKVRACSKCSKPNLAHGEYNSPTYISWSHMLQRVRGTGNPKDFHTYAHVTCCDSWYIYENFKTDMGERPPGKTLDRIDGSKGYYKDNCRWATIREQNNNKRGKK